MHVQPCRSTEGFGMLHASHCIAVARFNRVQAGQAHSTLGALFSVCTDCGFFATSNIEPLLTPEGFFNAAVLSAGVLGTRGGDNLVFNELAIALDKPFSLAG